MLESTEKRKLASRANGALSLGPKTPEGKARSARNATRHGLLAQVLLLDGESEEEFKQLLAQATERLNPQNDLEAGFVEATVICQRRLCRAWAIEAYLFQEAMDRTCGGTSIARLASAFTELAGTPKFRVLSRYQSQLGRDMRRSLGNIKLCRSLSVPAEPGPEPEQPPEPPELPADEISFPNEPRSPLDSTPGPVPETASPRPGVPAVNQPPDPKPNHPEPVLKLLTHYTR